MFTQAELTKTPQEKLIEWLENQKFTKEANSLRNDGTSLNLNYKKLGDTKVKELAELLKTNSTLTFLDLSSNGMNNPGAEELAAALTFNSTLTSLDLSVNKIKVSGAEALAGALKINYTLTYLDLTCNSIRDSKKANFAEKEIKEYLQRNKNSATQAETLNAQGDSFCGKGEYDKAIEKYNEAIAINKKPLYVTNKTNAEKIYEQQTK